MRQWQQHGQSLQREERRIPIRDQALIPAAVRDPGLRETARAIHQGRQRGLRVQCRKWRILAQFWRRLFISTVRSGFQPERKHCPHRRGLEEPTDLCDQEGNGRSSKQKVLPAGTQSHLRFGQADQPVFRR